MVMTDGGVGWPGVLGEMGQSHDLAISPVPYKLASDCVTSLQGSPGEAGYDGVDGEQVSCAAGHCTSRPVQPSLHPGTAARAGSGMGTGMGTGTASFLLPRANWGPPATLERRGPGGGRCGAARLSLGKALPPLPAAQLLNPFLLPSPRDRKAPGVPGGRRGPQALVEMW